MDVFQIPAVALFIGMIASFAVVMIYETCARVVLDGGLFF
jgi:hypothetical protein